ncbi:phage integrase N-terminal SAM-like domain-containing protein [Flammeovirgaceae bacterium SG7u.111]|nr:phage integrase N-terminal SAM-like domain-containing protein [Flammeovirgaceae bacterium SG7u.111]
MERGHRFTIFDTFKGVAWIDGGDVFRTFKRNGTDKKQGKPDEKVKPRTYPLTLECPKEYTDTLTRRRYSPNTIKSYVPLFTEFINFYPNKNFKEIEEEDIQAYMLYLAKERKVSVSYQNQAVNAIKFYYEQVLGRKREFYDLERPQKDFVLPKVLGEQEVAKMIEVTKNLKHRAIMSLLYAGGLRRSEALNLQMQDIHSDRGLILIRGGKGNKDRTTLLSPKLLVLLRKYYLQYKPKKWLFEGEKGGQYTGSSIQKKWIGPQRKQG